MVSAVSPAGKRIVADDTTVAMHFYCTDDVRCASPICGAVKPAVEKGEDCPLCGLVFEEIEAGERLCPFCGLPHWEEQS